MFIAYGDGQGGLLRRKERHPATHFLGALRNEDASSNLVIGNPEITRNSTISVPQLGKWGHPLFLVPFAFLPASNDNRKDCSIRGMS